MLAQSGRYDEANAALRLAERQAAALNADDVLAVVCVNQANVALIRHRYDQALALAERAAALQEGLGQGHGLAVALATLGQICVRIGNLQRAETVLHRALEVRSSVQFHEATTNTRRNICNVRLTPTVPTAGRRAAGTSGR
jgi:tetratricopeptide (TPR) repeat protein